jgi:hypothetical protein
MTNKIVLRSAEEFMNDYKPTYRALYPLLMKNSQAYPQVVGELNFRRATTVGDIRMKRITPKDTNIHQISVAEGKKTFKKYFDAAQFIQSIFQDTEGNEAIIVEVLDENEKLQDELMLFGEGTDNSTMLNNGIFYSGDANYTLENSKNIAAASTGYHLPDLHTQIMATISKADLVDGEKVMVLYGVDLLAKFDSLYVNSDAPFKRVLQDVAEGWTFIKMPADVTPASADGWIAINLDQIKVNYTVFPSLLSQGTNEEKMHTWHNFIMGSMMVEVKVKNGIIRQPVEFA